MHRRQFLQAAAIAPLVATVGSRPGRLRTVFVNGRAPRRWRGNTGASPQDPLPSLADALTRVVPGGTIFVSATHVESKMLHAAAHAKPPLALHFRNCRLDLA